MCAGVSGGYPVSKVSTAACSCCSHAGCSGAGAAGRLPASGSVHTQQTDGLCTAAAQPARHSHTHTLHAKLNVHILVITPEPSGPTSMNTTGHNSGATQSWSLQFLKMLLHILVTTPEQLCLGFCGFFGASHGFFVDEHSRKSSRSHASGTCCFRLLG